ncbi:MAG: alpha/beta fold hydrolase [Myxococcota bacterium]
MLAGRVRALCGIVAALFVVAGCAELAGRPNPSPAPARGVLIEIPGHGAVEHAVWRPAPNAAEGTVLLVHGTPGGWSQLASLAERLAESGFAAISFSRPGYHGTPLEAGASFEAQADLANALLERLGVARAAVVGVSGGGPVALQMALRHPERVPALVLVAAVTFESPGLELAAIRMPGRWDDLRARFTALRPQRALRRCGVADPERRQGYAADPALRRRLAALFRSLGRSRATNAGLRNDYAQAIARNPAGYPLSAIRARTLGIYGRDDPVVPPVHGERLQHEIAGGRLELVDGGHCFFVLDEEAVVERIVRFLEDRSGGAAAAPAATQPDRGSSSGDEQPKNRAQTDRGDGSSRSSS